MVGLFIINYMKFRSDIIISRNKSDKSHEILEKKLSKLESALDKEITEREFKHKLSNSITRKAFDVIQYNNFLSKEFISILNMTQVKINNFAIDYFDSHYRVNKDVARDYLNVVANSIREDIKHLELDLFKGEKRGLKFNDFVRKYSNIDTVINVMIQRLVENGLDRKMYIHLFENFIADLFTEFIKGYRTWERL